jgi:hypothetical protein
MVTTMTGEVHRKMQWHRRRIQWHRPHVSLAQSGEVTRLMIWQLAALAGQVVAVALARHEHRIIAEVISDISLGAAYGRALWTLTAAHLDKRTRNIAVLCLGIVPTLMWRATNPLLFTGFDEQLHMRTLGDILSSHRLFEANPLLEVSPRYPGLEVVTTLLHQIGFPTMAAATVVILVCRVVLVFALCDAVEHLTGSERAGGLAVAIYALSSQFVFFNSQFAYQTMALPLALAAVSFIVRAQEATDPRPNLIGATLCLLAVAVTHHVTSFLTAGLMLAWLIVENGRGRLWVAYGACAAIGSTLLWALVQRQLLSDYFGPIINDVGAQVASGARREVFKDNAGTEARPLDQYLLLYYAAVMSLIVAVVMVAAYREGHLRWGRLLLLIGLTASVPIGLAARVVPSGGQLFDRSSSFVFIPFSMYVASFAAWHWWRESHHYGFQQHRRMVQIRVVGVLLAAAAFLGGYVLGSGPSWARLPGPFMAAADTRSMDSETLAAAKWARTALAPGSRIAADRVSSTLLASQAGLWPVMKGPRGIDAPALYVAPTWGMTETDMAGAMRLRYIYVDRRLAAEKPPFGSYFFKGETGNGEQLTDKQLTKFDKVPGIKVVYRHGPVSIYDLTDLGIPEFRSGWYQPTPEVRVGTQLLVGVAGGLPVVLIMLTPIWPRIRSVIARTYASWGRALTAAAVLAVACLVSVLLLLSGVWLTPLAVLTGVGVVVAANIAGVARLLRTAVRSVSARQLRTVALVGVPLAIIVGAAAYSAATEDIIEVGRILNDPAAIHAPPRGSGG